MQNFTINDYDSREAREPQPSTSLSQQVDLGEHIGFINCKSGLLISYPLETDNRLDYMVPVCLGYC